VSVYIALAIASQGSNTFTIQENTKAFGAPYYQGVRYPAREPRYGVSDNLFIDLPMGTRIGVVAGFTTSGGTMAQVLIFNYTGGIAIEYTS
jgi:hypothetical protein